VLAVAPATVLLLRVENLGDALLPPVIANRARALHQRSFVVSCASVVTYIAQRYEWRRVADEDRLNVAC
jgi:hypothetical protein